MTSRCAPRVCLIAHNDARDGPGTPPRPRAAGAGSAATRVEATSSSAGALLRPGIDTDGTAFRGNRPTHTTPHAHTQPRSKRHLPEGGIHVPHPHQEARAGPA